MASPISQPPSRTPSYAVCPTSRAGHYSTPLGIVSPGGDLQAVEAAYISQYLTSTGEPLKICLGPTTDNGSRVAYATRTAVPLKLQDATTEQTTALAIAEKMLRTQLLDQLIADMNQYKALLSHAISRHNSDPRNAGIFLLNTTIGGGLLFWVVPTLRDIGFLQLTREPRWTFAPLARLQTEYLRHVFYKLARDTGCPGNGLDDMHKALLGNGWKSIVTISASGVLLFTMGNLLNPPPPVAPTSSGNAATAGGTALQTTALQILAELAQNYLPNDAPGRANGLSTKLAQRSEETLRKEAQLAGLTMECKILDLQLQSAKDHSKRDMISLLTLSLEQPLLTFLYQGSSLAEKVKDRNSHLTEELWRRSGLGRCGENPAPGRRVVRLPETKPVPKSTGGTTQTLEIVAIAAAGALVAGGIVVIIATDGVATPAVLAAIRAVLPAMRVALPALAPVL